MIFVRRLSLSPPSRGVGGLQSAWPPPAWPWTGSWSRGWWWRVLQYVKLWVSSPTTVQAGWAGWDLADWDSGTYQVVSEEWQLGRAEREREKGGISSFAVKAHASCRVGTCFFTPVNCQEPGSEPYYYAPTDHLTHLHRSDRYEGQHPGPSVETQWGVTRRYNDIRHLTASLTYDLEDTTTVAV